MGFRGRPKGSKNKSYETVDIQPPSCPKCGSTDLKPIRGAKLIVRDIAGTTITGIEYTRVTWRRSICDCGQHVIVRRYENQNTSGIKTTLEDL